MRFILVALACLTTVAAGSAHAQPETGSNITRHRSPGPIDPRDPDAGPRAMNAFGRCVAQSRLRWAENVLAMPLYSEEQHETVRRAISGIEGCWQAGADLQFPAQLLIGGMAEHFIETRYRDTDLGRFAGLTNERMIQMGITPLSAYERLAICVVARDPAAVRDLIRAVPRTTSEGDAFRRVFPNLPPCVPNGFTMSFSRVELRAILSSGLYRALSARPANQAAAASSQETGQ